MKNSIKKKEYFILIGVLKSKNQNEDYHYCWGDYDRDVVVAEKEEYKFEYKFLKVVRMESECFKEICQYIDSMNDANEVKQMKKRIASMCK